MHPFIVENTKKTIRNLMLAYQLLIKLTFEILSEM